MNDRDKAQDKEADQTRRHDLEQQNKTMENQAGSPGEQHRGGPLPNEKK